MLAKPGDEVCDLEDLDGPPQYAQDGYHGLKRFVYTQIERPEGDEKLLLPIPKGFTHPDPRLEMSIPHARGSPCHDEVGHAWAGRIGEFMHISCFPQSWVRKETADGIATVTASQLQQLGIWNDHLRLQFGQRPRIKRPWPVLATYDNTARRLRCINAEDDGSVVDRAQPPIFTYQGRMNWFEGSVAWRDNQFMSVSLGFQLDLKNDVEYLARTMDPTQPEYWRERDQVKYETEYLSTRLIVPVNPVIVSCLAIVARGDDLIRPLKRSGLRDISGTFVHTTDGGMERINVNLKLRIGQPHREPIRGAEQVPCLWDVLDYSKSPTIWIYTRFYVCKSRPRANPKIGAQFQDDKTKERIKATYDGLRNMPSKLEHPPFENIPILQEHIPFEHLPDILMVYDQDGITTKMPNEQEWKRRHDRDFVARQAHDSDTLYPIQDSAVKLPEGEPVADGTRPPSPARSPPVQYRRVLPKLSAYDKALENGHRVPVIAHLEMSSSKLLGTGNHSLVHESVLQLPLPLNTTDGIGCVRVAAKTAYQGPRAENAYRMLDKEAQVLAEMPHVLLDDWTGFVKTYPIREPVPTGAVAPKFYGYYTPVVNQGRPFESTSQEPKRSEVLLMEHCGKTIDAAKLNGDDIREVYSLLLRLHQQDVLQGSFEERNFLVQPGPLNLPPSQRSLDTPSFRIIDFGRGQTFTNYWKSKSAARDEKPSWEVTKEFMRMKFNEQRQAQDRIRLTERPRCEDYCKICPV